MLLAIGARADPVLVHFIAQARLLGKSVAGIDLQRVVAEGVWELNVPARESDYLAAGGAKSWHVSEYSAIFVRLIRPQAVTADEENRWAALITALRAWLQIVPSRVINRPLVHQHNAAKPWHEAWLSAGGFRVPESLTSSDRVALTEFAEGGPTVLKTCCGVRADSRRVAAEELATYEPDRGPLHLQRLVAGHDVRVHVVSEQVIACRFGSSLVDYRREVGVQGVAATVPDELAHKLVGATRRQGLRFAGWDFKVDSEGDYWCLEANPMPGYAWYDRALHGRITRALLDDMADGSPTRT